MHERKIASIAMTSTADKEANLKKAESLVREAAEKGADWVLLPELFSYMGDYSKLYEAAEFSDGPLSKTIAGWARELRVSLFAGSLPERPNKEDLSRLRADELVNKEGQRKVYNTFYAYASSGELIAKYRKTHLFELRGEAGSNEANTKLYSETDGFIAGDELVSFEHEGWHIACSICYDLRFPQVYESLARRRAIDLILVPSAFTFATGRDHWQMLLSTRGVEQQSYVCAANQTGTHRPGKESWGHSMLVDPWGKVLVQTGEKPGLAIASLSKELLAAYRKRLPVLANRRPQLYDAAAH